MEYKLNSVVIKSISLHPISIEISTETPLSGEGFSAAFREEAKFDSYNIFAITNEERFVRFYIAPKAIGVPVEDSSFFIDVPMRRVISLHYDRINSHSIPLSMPIQSHHNRNSS